MTKPSQNVVVLGASEDPARYSHQAVLLLLKHGHPVVPVHPRAHSVAGIPVTASLAEVAGPVDTLTVYVSPAISANLESDILRLRPRRVIFNPGSENPSLRSHLEEKGIKVEEACTLVLLRMNQFDFGH